MNGSETTRPRQFRVGGMDCPSCAASVERALGTLPGIGEVRVDVMRGTVHVAGGPEAPPNVRVVAAIRRAGYKVIDTPDGLPAQGKGRLYAAIAGGVLLGAGLVVSWTGGAPALAVPLLATATLISSWYVIPRALGSLRSRALDIHVLMTVAAIGAAIIGQWGEAAAAMWLFGVAQWLEGYAVGRARHAITALMQVIPSEATVRREGRDVRVPVEGVGLGEQILIRPGDRVPLDGVILSGNSSLDQSPITGESVPVDREPGMSVYAGSINGAGSLEVEVTHRADDTSLARILHAVEEAQASRAPSQSFVDRFAAIYTPLVVLLALGVAVVPPLLTGAGWDMWVTRGLTLLVVACPCALVIATPVTITSGLAGAARHGVLIKGGAQLESLAEITAVVFDKTGTLTEGRLAVTDIVALNGISEAEVLRLAAGVEQHSEHPVARAIVSRALEQGIAPPEPSGFAAMSGSGAHAHVEGRDLFLGNLRVCEELGNCHTAAHALVERFATEGKTGVLLMDREGPIGALALADTVRESAGPAVEALRARGIGVVAMLTGDNRAVAESVGRTLKLDAVHATLLPGEKREAVLALQRAGHRVGVVGDGINDTPALASADVGIAMGVAGTPAALEVADVALMGEDLTALPAALGRARRTRSILRANLILALGLKGIFLVLAGAGVATLWMAVAADTGASVLVVANALRAMGGRGRG